MLRCWPTSELMTLRVSMSSTHRLDPSMLRTKGRLTVRQNADNEKAHVAPLLMREDACKLIADMQDLCISNQNEEERVHPDLRSREVYEVQARARTREPSTTQLSKISDGCNPVRTASVEMMLGAESEGRMMDHFK